MCVPRPAPARLLFGHCTPVNGTPNASPPPAQGIQEDCADFLSWPWFGWALQVAVLAAVLAAWATANIHSYKQSLWALAAVVLFTACHAGNKLFIMQPYSKGRLHDRQVLGTLWLLLGVLLGCCWAS